MQKFGAALSVVLLSCIACPFDNPYEKYGESCSSDTDCGEGLGLVCASDGTCRGKPCANTEACQSDNPNLVCLAGRCAPKGIGDAGPGDAAGSDAARTDAQAGDAQGGDGAVVVPDAYVGDLWIPDVRELMDHASADQAAGSDAFAVDSAQPDAALDDGSLPEAAVPPVEAGSPDGAPQGCAFDERRMPDGTCSPQVCNASRSCSSSYACVAPQAGLDGICAPESCTTDTDCHSPMLLCDVGQSICKPRRGGEYNGCLVEPGAQSWCGPGLSCRPMGPQSLGVCLRDCQDDSACGGTYRCLHVGDDGRLDSGRSGVCLAECDGSTAVTLPVEPMPFDIPLYCSMTASGGGIGLLYAMSTDYFGMSCSATDPCFGEPFVCLAFGGTSTGLCTLSAEALMWQALEQARIVPAKAQRSDNTQFSRCPSGLYPAIGPDGLGLCVPQCRNDEDCTGVVPAAWSPACVDVNAGGVGHCSTLANTDNQCWLQDHSGAAYNTPCVQGIIADSDDDGWPDGIDACLDDFGQGNGCSGPGMCRVKSECLPGAYCVAGECLRSGDFCHPTSTGCPPGMTAMGASSACQSSETACVPDAPFAYPNGFCVDDSDCAALPNCTISNGCRCVANQCQLVQSTNGFYGVQPPPFELIRCQSSLDCPQGGSCNLDKNRCEPARKGPPAACVTSTDCPDSANSLCVAGVCAPKSFGTTTCLGETITVSGQSYCLDCMQLNQPNPPWSPGTNRTNLGGGTCPCNMFRDANGYCYRDPSKALCPGGDVNQCPAGDFDCIGDHCVPRQSPPPAECGLGADLVGDKCVSCIGAAEAGQSWNLPCFASDDPLCPCGLQCLPDAEGNGTCLALGDDVDCMDAPPPDGSACDGGGFYYQGRCLHDINQWCNSSAECDPDQACILSYCVPSDLPTCASDTSPCTVSGEPGICLYESANGGRCVPLVISSQLGLPCSSEFTSCGYGCACLPDLANGLMPTEITPHDCPAGQWSVGYAPCQPLSSLPVVTNGPVGAPCSAGVLPGRVVDDNGTRRCKPSGQTPSPGCGFGGTTTCAAGEICQLGQCLPVADALGATDCEPFSSDVISLPDGGTTCRLPGLPMQTSCDEFSSLCTYKGIKRGGVCVETSNSNNGMCYPRAGCQLALDGETCIDGAPIPLDALGFEPRCSPWSDTSCALVAGGCSFGYCRPVDGAGGLCLDDAECHHWLECGPGQICRDRSCVQYVVSESIAAGSLCDVGPYGYGLSAVAYGQSAMPKTCYLRDDPRCAGKPRGAPCSALYPDPMSGGGPLTQGVCTSQGACVESSVFRSGGCTAEGQICNFGSVSGVCVEYRPSAGWVCVP